MSKLLSSIMVMLCFLGFSGMTSIVSASDDFEQNIRYITYEEYVKEVENFKKQQTEMKSMQEDSDDIKPLYEEYEVFSHYDPTRAYHNNFYYKMGSYTAINRTSGKMTATYTQQQNVSMQAAWGQAGSMGGGVKVAVFEYGVNYSRSTSESVSISYGTTVGASVEVPPNSTVTLTLYYAGTTVDGRLVYKVYDWEGNFVGTRFKPSTDVMPDAGKVTIVAN